MCRVDVFSISKSSRVSIKVYQVWWWFLTFGRKKQIEMPVLGIGTDILRISRFHSIIERSGGLLSPVLLKLAARILNNDIANKHSELIRFQHFQRRNDIEGAVRLLSNSWCTKEAVYKSLSSDSQSKFRMRDWYKYNTETGLPKIRNDQYIKQYPHEEFLLTISHDNDTLISTVLRQSL